jgi:putative DNA primase/helicase
MFRILEKRLKDILNTRLREIWADHPKKIPSEPSGTLYGRNFLVNRHGVWFRQAVAGLGDLNVWRRIAKTRIDPEALSFDTTPARNCQHRYLVTGETGQFPVDIAAEHLGRDANRAINTLMRRGVHIVESRPARQQLAQFLRNRPRKCIIRAPRTGWFECRRRWVFVLPDEVLGATDTLHIILDGTTRSDGYGFHRAGTSEEWRDHVAIPLTGNSNVVLAVGTMLAAPLLCWADEPAGGFHFYGDSKVGKTLACAIGQSIWGRPFVPGAGPDVFGFTWGSTANALEERAVLRNDVGFYLDEIGVGERKPITTAIYVLTGGLGRGRMRQRQLTFNVLILSTGETSVARFLGDDVRAGQMVRLTDVPAAVQAPSAFELFPAEQIAAVGQRFYAATRDYHGAVGHDWLEYLVHLGPKYIKQNLDRLRDAWLAQSAVTEIRERAHPQVVSVINRFGLVAAALAMAIEAEILPWSKTDTDAAIIACMQRWVNQRGNVDEAGELLREIERRRNRFAVTADARLIHLAFDGRRRLVAASPTDEQKLKAAEQFDGYVKNGRILLKPDAWQHLWDGLDGKAVKQVKQHLLRQGLLIADSDGKVPSGEKIQEQRTNRKVLRACIGIHRTRVTA